VAIFIAFAISTKAFDKGEKLYAVKDTVAYFNDEVMFNIYEGESIVVLRHDSNTGKVYYLVTDNSGKLVALNVKARDFVSRGGQAGGDGAGNPQSVEGEWKPHVWTSPGSAAYREKTYYELDVIDATYGEVRVKAAGEAMEDQIKTLLASGIKDKIRVTGSFWKDAFGREDRSRGFMATQIRTIADQAMKSLSLVDLLISPETYLDKTVTIEGVFNYQNAERKVLTIRQGSNKIDVFYGATPRESWRAILSQDVTSDAKVSVVGIVKKYRDSENSYYIDAASVSVRNDK